MGPGRLGVGATGRKAVVALTVAGGSLTRADLGRAIGAHRNTLPALLDRMAGHGLVTVDGRTVTLVPAGVRRACKPKRRSRRNRLRKRHAAERRTWRAKHDEFVERRQRERQAEAELVREHIARRRRRGECTAAAFAQRPSAPEARTYVPASSRKPASDLGRPTSSEEARAQRARFEASRSTGRPTVHEEMAELSACREPEPAPTTARRCGELSGRGLALARARAA